MSTDPGEQESTERPAIGLQINGKGLLVRGAFGSWQSRLVMGPDLDQVGVNLFVDATSVRTDGDDDVGEKLFSFRSRSVTPSGRGTYRVLGDFTGAEETRELEIKVETPLGHTPLFVISFDAEKRDFGEGWTHLLENVAPFGQTREAAAWLTTPDLAAA
jgi:polyisoprenoid-binding protein YceI